MTTTLPIGTRDQYTFQTVKKGDILRLVTGEKCTYLSMSRTRFSGVLNGKPYKIPVYRDKSMTTPYVVSIDGFDESVNANKVEHTDLEPRQLFALDGMKETFMFKEVIGNRIMAINIATNLPARIRIGDFTIKKVNLDDITF